MAKSRKKSSSPKPKMPGGEVTFVEIPCDEYKVYAASIGGEGGTDPTQRTVLLSGPAVDVERIVTALRRRL